MKITTTKSVEIEIEVTVPMFLSNGVSALKLFREPLNDYDQPVMMVHSEGSYQQISLNTTHTFNLYYKDVLELTDTKWRVCDEAEFIKVYNIASDKLKQIAISIPEEKQIEELTEEERIENIAADRFDRSKPSNQD